MLRRRVHHKAKDGTNGLGKSKHGTRGVDTIIPVPPGTIIRYHQSLIVKLKFYLLHHETISMFFPGRDEDGILAGEVNHHGQRLLVAKGGKGGRGKVIFFLSF